MSKAGRREHNKAGCEGGELAVGRSTHVQVGFKFCVCAHGTSRAKTCFTRGWRILGNGLLTLLHPNLSPLLPAVSGCSECLRSHTLLSSFASSKHRLLFSSRFTSKLTQLQKPTSLNSDENYRNLCAALQNLEMSHVFILFAQKLTFHLHNAQWWY